MRLFLRPLFLIAILSITGWIGYTYRQRMEDQAGKAPKRPTALPNNIKASARNWTWEKSAGDGPAWSGRAKNFRHIQDKNTFELEGLDLKIYRKDGKTFDQVLSDRAEFNLTEGYLYTEGTAHITMGLAEGEEPSANRVVKIKSSGIRLNSKTGQAETEREVEFDLERGKGKAVGAVYNPTTRELRLKRDAQLTWTAGKSPMRVNSSEVVYLERESKVLLGAPSRFARANLTLEGAGGVVTLDKHGVRLVETSQAKGTDKLPGRDVEYAADLLTLRLNEKSEVERIEGTGNARFRTLTEQGETNTSTNRVDMEFDLSSGESVLNRVLATGQSVVDSKPIAREGRLQPESRRLASDVIELKMRAGGRDVSTIETQSAGVLEFFPNRAGQRKRRVEGERFKVIYGPENQLERFDVTKAFTQTENEPKQGKPQPPAKTWSQNLTASFAPRTGELTLLEQVGEFRYEEGPRRAQADKAVLDNPRQHITLENRARLWDETGSTSADRILLDQKTEDFEATGNVASSRLPDKKSTGQGLLSGEQPVQARAKRMITADRQAKVTYEGNAVLWQGASRLTATLIDIDRKNSALSARGDVFNQLVESSEKKKPVYTVIRAQNLLYRDRERLAHYSGNVSLKRDALTVESQQLRAFLSEAKKPEQSGAGARPSEGSSLEKAVADGSVRIHSTANGRSRRGASEHAEYFTGEERVQLEGGDPTLDDSLRGVTRGRQLIYYANDDRLLVNGIPAQPAKSTLKRK